MRVQLWNYYSVWQRETKVVILLYTKGTVPKVSQLFLNSHRLTCIFGQARKLTVGGKKGNRTEPNRTTGLYRTEPTETSDSCGTGFYRHF